jgi:hypothetical protein
MVSFKAKEESTSFCEQKEAKKLYSFLVPGCFNTARSGAKKFFWFLRPDDVA